MAGLDKSESVAGAEMSGTRELYDEWAATYDRVANSTRDLEKRACENVLGGSYYETVLELGGGTGKNTEWLADRSRQVISVDLSTEMQAAAKRKVSAENVDFRIGDIREAWTFAEPADLITCSLILEHVEDLHHIFREAAKRLRPGGQFYICELHPFKQYTGSKARFESDEGLKVLECFPHHVTDYTTAAMRNHFIIERMEEWFDNDDRGGIPRLISFIFVCR